MLLWPCVSSVVVLSSVTELHNTPRRSVGGRRSDAQTVCWMAWKARVVDRMPAHALALAPVLLCRIERRTKPDAAHFNKLMTFTKPIDVAIEHTILVGPDARGTIEQCSLMRWAAFDGRKKARLLRHLTTHYS